ncbi:MAG: PAS domain S-box protein [Chloroflexota bacterium]|nr:PAS domain S-box protein [Chloroflexota bacterium]
MSKNQTPNSDAEQRHDARPDEAGEQEALRASELRYRRLFESAQDGILILDADTGMIVDVNPFLVNLLGYSHEVFLTKKVWELGFLEDAIANEDKFRELRAKDYARYEDLSLEASDGRRIEVEFVSNVYQVNEQRVIQCIIRDITARKQAEEAHKERLKELTLLQSISQIVQEGDSWESICQKIAYVMPKAWCYPEIARARIICEGQSYQTENFSKTEWCLSADLKVKDKSVGTVEVFYLEEPPPGTKALSSRKKGT